MHRLLTVSAIFSTLIFHHSSFALQNENQLRCLYSQAATRQNIDIKVTECSYLFPFDLGKLTDSFTLYPLLSLGAVMSARDYGVLLGGGLGMNYSFFKNVDLYFEGGSSWLTDVEYGKRGEALKDYGGHVMFFAKLGLQYNFVTNWAIGYFFLHLSNGNIYQVNPGFDGHSISISYHF
jgi:hypothetical protein